MGEVWARTPIASPAGEVSFIPPGMDFLSNQKITHVTFADGCCEVDKKGCSEGAVKVGKVHESRPKGGEHLSEEFRKKNDKLLKYVRTPELTVYKTPTGKTLVVF